MSPRSWEAMVEITKVHEAYTPKALTKIAAELGTTATPQFCGQIRRTAQAFYGWYHRQTGPSPTVIRQTLTTLYQQVETLSSQIRATQAALEQLDDLSRSELECLRDEYGPRTAQQLLEETQQVVYQCWMQDCTTLGPFRQHIQTTLQQLPPPKRGKPREWALKNFLGELASIYYHYTGKPLRVSKTGGKTYSGPLFRFICACVAPLEHCEPFSTLKPMTQYPQVLGDHLKEVLPLRRRLLRGNDIA